MPDGSERSSGSRVRFPVRTTRLMLVAAMVVGAPFRLVVLEGESTSGIGGTGLNGRFLRTIDAVSLHVVADGTQIGPFATLFGRRPHGVWPRAREARIRSETAAREVSTSGEAAQPADAPA